MCSVQTCYFLTSSAGHTPTWTTKSQSYVETWPQWCHPTSADFFFFFWPCSITSFLSVWLCIWELQKPHTSSCNSESPTLRPHSWQPGQPNWLCPVHHLWFTQSWIENIAGRRNFFYYKNLEIKMVFFFFFFHHLHQPHGNEKSSPCLATGVLSECGGHVGSVCLVYLLFLFLFLILEFLFLSCIKGLSVKSPL